MGARNPRLPAGTGSGVSTLFLPCNDRRGSSDPSILHDYCRETPPRFTLIQHKRWSCLGFPAMSPATCGKRVCNAVETRKDRRQGSKRPEVMDLCALQKSVKISVTYKIASSLCSKLEALPLRLPQGIRSVQVIHRHFSELNGGKAFFTRYSRPDTTHRWEWGTSYLSPARYPRLRRRGRRET